MRQSGKKSYPSERRLILEKYPEETCEYWPVLQTTLATENNTIILYTTSGNLIVGDGGSARTDESDSDSQSHLTKVIASAGGGLVFFALVIVVSLVVSCKCAKKGKRRSSVTSTSVTHTSRLDDEEIYDRIDESYIIDQDIDHTADVMLPIRQGHTGFHRRLTNRFLRWLSIEGTTSVTENMIAEPRTTAPGLPDRNYARIRLDAIAETAERTQPLLNCGTEQSQRENIYNPLTPEPVDGGYEQLLRNSFVINTKKDGNVNDSSDNIPSSEYFILEKEDDMKTNNEGAGPAVVIAADFIENDLSSNDRTSVVRTSYLVPNTISFKSTNKNNIQNTDFNKMSSTDRLKHYSDASFKKKDTSSATDCSDQVQGTNGESMSNAVDGRDDTRSGDSCEDNSHPERHSVHDYFILEKDKGTSPTTTGDNGDSCEDNSHPERHNVHDYFILEKDKGTSPTTTGDNTNVIDINEIDHTSVIADGVMSEYYVLDKPETQSS